MPLALRELQAAFAAEVVGEPAGPSRADLAGEIASDAIPATARLAIYRHHVRTSLGAALAATFPTVQALVGADFFGRLARDFVGRVLPSQPVLSEYGAALADFIAGYQPALGLPYLADVARLDWALNAAFHAPAMPCLGVADLSAIEVERLPGLCLTLAAGATVIRSLYPLEHIWRACQADAPAGTVDLALGGCELLVLRRSDDAAFVSLSAGEAAFVTAVGEGRTLEQAAGRALGIDPAFDLSTSFARLLAVQAFAALQ